jgi:aspartate/methionine/tyrosine aminotransferase
MVILKSANPIFAALGTTIFETMSRMAAAHGAINLGQGFPEGLEPAFLLEAAARKIMAGPHQYCPMMGTTALRQAVADTAHRFYGLTVDPATEVMVTSGATEADSLFGLLEPGDEVVVLEPAYDSYLPIIRQAGAIPRLVRLEPPAWTLPRSALAAAFGPRTKLMILNSPMNPIGKVFDADELAFIAGLLQRHDAYGVCDEVYEHLVYDGRRHIPLMSLPGMRDRCVRIGSAGKTFSVTGWKIGYVTACPNVLTPIARAHQFITFTTPGTLQDAVAEGLGVGDSYFSDLAAGLAQKRDRLSEGLRGIGFDVLPTAGSYFLVADIRPLGDGGGDLAFCRALVERAGVAAIPVSAFFQGDGVRHLIRFCFAKPDDALEEAIRRLGTAFRD